MDTVSVSFTSAFSGLFHLICLPARLGCQLLTDENKRIARIDGDTNNSSKIQPSYHHGRVSLNSRPWK